MCKTPGFEPKVMDSMQDKDASKSHLKLSLWQLPQRGGMRSHCCSVSFVELLPLSGV
jgi:hypothetical protein